jgi:hypothetical protein
VYGEITPLDFVQFALVKYDVKPTTQNTEGGGVWAEHLRWAAPESVALCLGAFTVLVPIWLRWVRRVRPGGLVHAWVGQIVLNCNVFKT